MPLIKQAECDFPQWCEVDFFEIVRLEKSEKVSFSRRSRCELLILAESSCEVLTPDDIKINASRGTSLMIDEKSSSFGQTTARWPSMLLRITGNWSENIGGAGIMLVGDGDNRKGGGDPVNYTKNTRFDNHFHDFDEYWFFYEGSGIAYSENNRYEVNPGDCIATKAGDHHDVSELFTDTLKGVWFETTIKPDDRRGHLWSIDAG